MQLRNLIALNCTVLRCSHAIVKTQTGTMYPFKKTFFLLLKIVCVLPPLPELINDRVLLKDFLKLKYMYMYSNAEHCNSVIKLREINIVEIDHDHPGLLTLHPRMLCVLFDLSRSRSLYSTMYFRRN